MNKEQDNLIYIVGQPDSNNWKWDELHVHSIHTTEEAGIKVAAELDTFIIESELGKELPTLVVDCRRCWFPKQETWEESVLYRIQQGELDRENYVDLSVDTIPRKDMLVSYRYEIDCVNNIEATCLQQRIAAALVPVTFAVSNLGRILRRFDSKHLFSYPCINRIGYQYLFGESTVVDKTISGILVCDRWCDVTGDTLLDVLKHMDVIGCTSPAIIIEKE